MIPNVIKSCVMLTLIVASVVSNTYSQGADEKYNLLFIITDQQRFDALSAAGNTVLQTPNMDRIAEGGVIFEKAYTPVPVCGPTRTCLLSGQNLNNTGIKSNEFVYDPAQYKGGPSFDQLLSDAGYRTSYYGKWHSPQTLADKYENLGYCMYVMDIT